VQQETAGAGGVVHEHDLAGAELRGGGRLREHHVARLDAGCHGAAGHHVCGEARQLGGERGEDQPGEAGERQRREHAGRADHGVAPPFHPGHGVFCASQTKFAVDVLLWAELLSATQ
jgi:hypothetical protein